MSFGLPSALIRPSRASPKAPRSPRSAAVPGRQTTVTTVVDADGFTGRWTASSTVNSLARSEVVDDPIDGEIEPGPAGP